MIIIVAPSASGKDTIMNEVVKRTTLKPVVSYTTRLPRQGEVDGIAYNFITEDEFQKKVSENFFIETSNYRGWHYGMARKDCGVDGIVIVDPCGLRSLKREGIYIISFYITVDERERLIRLANRGDDITELCRRIISDRDTFRGIENEVSFIIENEDLETATNEMLSKLKYWEVV